MVTWMSSSLLARLTNSRQGKCPGSSGSTVSGRTAYHSSSESTSGTYPPGQYVQLLEYVLLVQLECGYAVCAGTPTTLWRIQEPSVRIGPSQIALTWEPRKPHGTT